MAWDSFRKLFSTDAQPPAKGPGARKSAASTPAPAERKPAPPPSTTRIVSPLMSVLARIENKGPNPSLTILRQMCDAWVKEGNVTEDLLASNLSKMVSKVGDTFIGHLLVAEQVITEEELLYTLSRICRIPCYNISQYEINPNALRALPAELARKYEVLPVDRMGRILTIAVTNPFLKFRFLEGQKRQIDIRMVLCSRQELLTHLDIYYPQELGHLPSSCELIETAPPPLPSPAPQPPPEPRDPEDVVAQPARAAAQTAESAVVGLAPNGAPVNGRAKLDELFKRWAGSGAEPGALSAVPLFPEELDFYLRR